MMPYKPSFLFILPIFVFLNFIQYSTFNPLTLLFIAGKGLYNPPPGAKRNHWASVLCVSPSHLMKRSRATPCLPPEQAPGPRAGYLPCFSASPPPAPDLGSWRHLFAFLQSPSLIARLQELFIARDRRLHREPTAHLYLCSLFMHSDAEAKPQNPIQHKIRKWAYQHFCMYYIQRSFYLDQLRANLPYLRAQEWHRQYVSYVAFQLYKASQRGEAGYFGDNLLKEHMTTIKSDDPDSGIPSLLVPIWLTIWRRSQDLPLLLHKW